MPADYEQSNNSYPVHFVTDAPATANIYHDLLRLHSSVNAMPQSIVVGLSSDDREFNLHPQKGAKKYLDFVENEVIPFVEKNYRTKSFRAIAGHSLGGGFAIYAFLSRMNLFNLCIAGSPYQIEYMTNMIRSENVMNKTSEYRFFYCSVGTAGDIPESQLINLKKEMTNAPENVDSHFQIHEGANHISNLALNFQDGLMTYYPDWEFVLPDTLNAPVDELLKKHYKNLSAKVGYSVEASEWKIIFPLMDKLAQRGDFKNAIRILKYCIGLYPQSDQAYAFLARAYLSIGDKESAKINLEKALSINPQNKFALELEKSLKK